MILWVGCSVFFSVTYFQLPFYGCVTCMTCVTQDLVSQV